MTNCNQRDECCVIRSNKNAPGKTQELASSVGIYKDPMPNTNPMPNTTSHVPPLSLKPMPRIPRNDSMTKKSWSGSATVITASIDI